MLSLSHKRMLGVLLFLAAVVAVTARGNSSVFAASLPHDAYGHTGITADDSCPDGQQTDQQHGRGDCARNGGDGSYYQQAYQPQPADQVQSAPAFSQTQALAVPAPVSYLWVTGTTTSAISIAWAPSPSGGVQNYVVAWWQYGYSGNWTYVWLAGSAQYFLQTNLPSFTRFAYEVQACNSAGCSSWSPMLNVATRGQLPGPPTNLYVTGVLANAISVGWTPSYSPDVQGYVVGIWQYGYSGAWTYIYLPGYNNSYLLSGLSPGTQYAFIVEAYNALGYSPWSNQVNQWTHSTYP